MIDLPPLKLEVIEHQVEHKVCPDCGCENEAAFPAEAKTSVQYGSRIKSLVVYLNQYQLVPYERTVQLVEDLFSRTISQGTLYTWNKACFQQLASAEERIRQAIIASEVVHFDETGLRAEGKLHWLHAAGTEQLTFYGLHARRGTEAMRDLGILEHYTGTAVHDHWKSYFTFSCDHSLCNAHHLRELTYLAEQDKQAWAKSMIALLLEAKTASESMPENCLAANSSELASILLRYDGLIKEGLAQNIPPPEEPWRVLRARSIGPTMEGFYDHEIEQMPAVDLQEYATSTRTPVDAPYSPAPTYQGARLSVPIHISGAMGVSLLLAS